VTAVHKTTSFYVSPQPQLLAEHTRPALGEHACCLCPRPVWRGQRIADVVGGRGPAHVGCVGQLAAGERR
jgi:hypothetical protein